MNMNRIGVLALALGVACGLGFADEKADEAAAILEVGAAKGSGYGPNFAIEVTPIENWLELEAGVSPLFSRHGTEWDTDLLFKKPWTISSKLEFMAGLGPEWVHDKSNAIAAEFVLDFMYWPWAKRRFGWYVEPGYDVSFASGHEHSFGISAGLLIAVGRR